MRQLKKIGNRMTRFLFVLTTLFFACLAHAAEVEVSSDVDRNSLNPDDTFTLTITVSAAKEVNVSEPKLPAMGDFDVINAWSGQETQATFITTPTGPEFKTVRSVHYNYMLQPKRQGSLMVGSAEVVVDGRSYLTKPIGVKVAPGAGLKTPPRGGRRGTKPPSGMNFPPGIFDDEEEDLFQQFLRRQLPKGAPPAVGSKRLAINPNDAFFVHVEADKTDVYVNEQITVSFYLYTKSQIRDLDTLKYPSLTGFWKEDLEISTRLNFIPEMVNGETYQKALLVSYALFPIKEGTATVDAYTAKCTVISLADQFGMGRPFVVTKSSPPLKINVKPIPTEGRPANYSGAVGGFQVSARVDDQNILSHQPFTFKIRFEGRGNAKLIDLPPFQPPEGMEVYDTQKDAKFFASGTSFKDFSVLMIPRREGEFTIPPMAVSIFDPQAKKFVTKATEPVRVNVGKGTAPTDNGAVGMAAGATPKADGAPELMVELKNYRPLGFKQTLFICVALVFLAFGALYLIARRELGWGERRKDLLRRLNSRMRKLEQKITAGDWRSVGVEATNIVYFILGELSGEGGANVEFAKLLAKVPPSIRHELSDSLSKQLELFQILSFAPESVVGDLKQPDKLRAAVNELNTLMAKAVQLSIVGESPAGKR